MHNKISDVRNIVETILYKCMKKNFKLGAIYFTVLCFTDLVSSFIVAQSVKIICFDLLLLASFLHHYSKARKYIVTI